VSDEVKDAAEVVDASSAVIDAEVVSAESIPVREMEENVKTYNVEVTTKFQVTGPTEIPNGDMKLLERAIWESMPAGFIGGELFVKFPATARNFNVNIKAEEAEAEAQN
jgi:hypothetical protein